MQFVGEVHDLVFFFLGDLVVAGCVSGVAGEDIGSALPDAGDIGRRDYVVFGFDGLLSGTRDVFEVFLGFALDWRRGKQTEELLHLFTLHFFLPGEPRGGRSLG